MHPIAGVALLAVTVMLAVWQVQRRTRNADWVDVAWSYLMAAAAIVYAATGAGATLPRLAVGILGATWGVRLGTHLAHRVWNEAEDGRYRQMRGAIGNHDGKWLAFFMLQAGFTVLFSLPFWVVAQNPVVGVTPWLGAGIVLFGVALAGESIADRQLARFRADPANRGRVCDIGLWRYSRHPNYFFEWLHWFSYVLLGVGAPCWWITPIGAALMGASLAWVTGIPFVEAQSLRSRGEAYREYQRRTSAFFPWFPRSGP